MIKTSTIKAYKNETLIIETAERLKSAWMRDEGYDLTWDEMQMLEMHGYIKELTGNSKRWEWMPTELLESL